MFAHLWMPCGLQCKQLVMNWINDLASKREQGTDNANYDEELFGVASDRGERMEILNDWLNKEYWNFNLGWFQFDGYSEGLCILAGIDPERSMRTAKEYGPFFLPNSIVAYGYDNITTNEQWHLKDEVDRRIDELKSLGLKGRFNCQKVLEICARYQLDPPWLDAANNDFACAKRLPSNLRTNANIIDRINRSMSSKGGQQRASKSAKTQLLSADGRDEFYRLSKLGFPECQAKSSGRTIATRVAHKIYNFLSMQDGGSSDKLPEITTVEENVRKWLE